MSNPRPVHSRKQNQVYDKRQARPLLILGAWPLLFFSILLGDAKLGLAPSPKLRRQGNEFLAEQGYTQPPGDFGKNKQRAAGSDLLAGFHRQEGHQWQNCPGD